MRDEKRNYRPDPNDALTRRMRLRHGLSEPSARMLASLCYGRAPRG
jgi:hypothetical protein